MVLELGPKGKYKKTKHTNMGNCKKEVTINGEKIKNTKLTKFLGIQIDHKLTLNKQKNDNSQSILLPDNILKRTENKV